MSLGRISPQLPYIRKKAVEVLKVNYPTRDLAKQSITGEIDNFYRTNYLRSIRRGTRWCSKQVRKFQRSTCGIFSRICA
jgi:hypothetical protein